MNGKSRFKTLVIIDLETTGLVYDEPKIIELAMIAVNISTLDEMKADEELPRILNKFVKFFDPIKPIRPKATELSELDNHMLINYEPFNRDTVVAIETFLNNFQKPLCFIAHNGNIFDFPILFNEIQSALSSNTNTIIPNDDIPIIEKDSNIDFNQTSLTSIACTDSLNFFREMRRLLNEGDIIEHPDDKSASLNPLDLSVSTSHRGYVEIPLKSDSTHQLPSMKLIKIYEREFNRTSNYKSHRAEDDCLMLLAIIKRYLPDWLEWIEQNHRLLSDFSFLPTINTTKKISPKTNVNIKRPFKF